MVRTARAWQHPPAAYREASPWPRTPELLSMNLQCFCAYSRVSIACLAPLHGVTTHTSGCSLSAAPNRRWLSQSSGESAMTVPHALRLRIIALAIVVLRRAELHSHEGDPRPAAFYARPGRCLPKAERGLLKALGLCAHASAQGGAALRASARALSAGNAGAHKGAGASMDFASGEVSRAACTCAAKASLEVSFCAHRVAPILRSWRRRARPNSCGSLPWTTAYDTLLDAISHPQRCFRPCGIRVHRCHKSCCGLVQGDAAAQGALQTLSSSEIPKRTSAHASSTLCHC